MKLVFLAAIIFTTFPTLAVDTRLSNVTNPVNCSVRLSNVRINRDGPADGQQFCAGSIVNSSVFVTSAHCMNQVVSRNISNLGNIPDGVRIQIAPLSESASFDAEILPGTRSAVYDSNMETNGQRNSYLSSGRDMAVAQYDIVVIKLKEPVLPHSQNCPQLPTPEECAEFENFAASHSPGKTYEALGASFYRSRYYESTDRLSRDVAYPSQNLVNGVPSRLHKNSLGYYEVEFVTPTLIEFEVGDSGSGLLLQKNQTRKLIVGTQSAKDGNRPGFAYFSSMCRLVGRPNYPLN